MKERKYELTNETIEVNGKTLRRIKALRYVDADCIDEVREGTLGGFIEKEENLSHEGNCWIFDNAKVYDNAKIMGESTVHDNAEVFDNAIICEESRICGNAKVYGNAKTEQACIICDDAQVFGDTIFKGGDLHDDAYVSCNEDYKRFHAEDLGLLITVSKSKHHNISVFIYDECCKEISVTEFINKITDKKENIIALD